MAAHLLGATTAGVAAGVLLGALGRLAGPTGRAGLLALGIALVAGAALEAGRGGLRLPTVRRQVNEDWLHRYRGWVYGVGFGFQLGLGVATVVTATAVYGTLLAAFLSGSPLGGAVIGGVFGLLRGATPLAAARVRTPVQLVAVAGALRRWERAARVGTLAAEAAIAVAAIGVALA